MPISRSELRVKALPLLSASVVSSPDNPGCKHSLRVEGLFHGAICFQVSGSINWRHYCANLSLCVLDIPHADVPVESKSLRVFWVFF